MPRRAETVAGTESRHSGPRLWRRALERTIAAGRLKGATATTKAVLEDLARRMDYGTGHVRYCLGETAGRIGADRSTVKRHIALLRSAGWLAWAEHGSLRNALRSLGRPGYAPTAAVYAAVIPRSFDAWAGNRLDGVGYGARVVGATEEGRGLQVAEAVDNQARKAVENPAKRSSAPPSLRVVKEDGQVELEGGLKDTSRKRASRQPRSISPKTSTSTPERRPARQVARDIWVATQVRPLVNWTQGESLRRLAFALRPLIDRGLDVTAIASDLYGWGITWRPERPAAVIRHRLALIAAQEQTSAAEIPWEDSTVRAQTLQAKVLQQLFGLTPPVEPEPERTDEDRLLARRTGYRHPEIVAAHLERFGPDDTFDLYGVQLTATAARIDAMQAGRIGAYA